MPKNLEVLAKETAASHAMMNSPVNFICVLLTSYASGEITLPELAARFRRTNRDAQFYFSHMPKEDIEMNKKLFRKEFVLADNLMDILLDRPIGRDDKESIDSRIAESLTQYLDSVRENGG